MLGIGRHSRLRTLLSSYIDGQVSAAEATQVEEHLFSCADCRLDVEDLRATVELLRELPVIEATRSFALASPPAPLRTAVSYVWATGLATSMAAVLLVALVLGDAFDIIAQAGPADMARVEDSVEKAAAAVPQAATLSTAAAPEGPVAAMAAAAPPPAAAPAAAEARVAAMAAAAPPPAAAPAAAEARVAAMAAAAPPPAAAPAAAEARVAAMAAPAPAAAMAAPIPAPVAAPAPAAADEAPRQEPEVSVVEEVETEAVVPASAEAAPAPSPEDAEAVTLRRRPLEQAEAPVLETLTSLVEEQPDDVSPTTDAIRLPLRQLQIALGAISVLLLLSTVWFGRRSLR